jgi:hypothetical protein
MVDTPKESQVHVCLGISYMLVLYHFKFMFSTLVLNLYSRMSKGLMWGSLLMVVKSLFLTVNFT